ncbi:MAG: helix-turn-helix domain-containing protein [Muribaculaceae bacterium]|nr:helix-turn-helix domain-containing protein [Muribaculaceae bacterium]
MGTTIIRILFCFTPFAVCLFWFLVFAVHHRHNDAAKKTLMCFLGVSSTLYFCHALYFTTGLSHGMECLWTLCSLSVYPLFFLYVCRLTSHKLSPAWLALLFVPGIVCATAKLLFPGDLADNVRKVLLFLQISCVLYKGLNLLRTYDRQLKDFYADTEGRDVTAVKHLLVAVVVTSACSAIANALGRDYFGQSIWLLLAVMLPFTTLLFALSYIGFMRNFTATQFATETADEPTPCGDEDDALPYNEDLGRKIEALMTDEEFFLTKNLTIGDVAKRAGSCRTYVSQYINATKHMSFSDYINHLRVEYAKKLLLEAQNEKIITISEKAGFSSEQSFYRNFRKFTGESPSTWQNKHA